MGYEGMDSEDKEEMAKWLSGLKVEDTPDRIAIKDTDGKYHDVDRDDIARMAKQALSIMPEALNETMTQTDLVDLVEYLAALKS